MNNTISVAYGDALFQVGYSENKLVKFYDELSSLESMFSEELIQFFSNPNITKEHKVEIIEQSFKSLDILLVNFFKLLVMKNRFKYINDIIIYFKKLYYKEFAIVEAHVYTATKLSDKQLEDLKVTFENKYKKQLKIIVIEDESLIAGMKVKINDDVYDNSLITQLNKLKARI